MPTCVQALVVLLSEEEWYVQSSAAQALCAVSTSPEMLHRCAWFLPMLSALCARLARPA
jgi:hypothetical protein